jgi:hypothetical protein
MESLTKAVAIARDGSLENIDRTLGGMKVRSFYNNLADPFNRFDLNVTIDTHHFGVANGLPFTASDRYMSSGSYNVTETPESKPAGVGGTYPLVVEATRRAAAAFNEAHGTNYLPNQFQSIVWEMWRADYPSDYRGIDLLKRLEKIRTTRAIGLRARAQARITPDEEARLIETARLASGAPRPSEILAWFKRDLEGLPRPTLSQMRKRRR